MKVKVNGGVSNMSKVLTFSLFLFTFSLVSFHASATPSWSAVYTLEYEGDAAVGSEASIQGYSGYLCTSEAAKSMFGGATSADDITSYLTKNFSSVTWEGQEGVKALASSGFEDTQYALKLADGTSYSSTDFIAIALFGSETATEAFRVFGAGSGELMGSSLVFDDHESAAATTTVGVWTTVPEPTSALLLLLGVAGLALKRKRA